MTYVQKKRGRGELLPPEAIVVWDSTKISKNFGAVPRLQYVRTIFLHFSRKKHGKFYTATKRATELTRKRVV